MRIRIQFNSNKGYDFTFGYSSSLHKSMYWLSIDTVWFDYYGGVEFAKSHVNLFKSYKYWFK